MPTLKQEVMSEIVVTNEYVPITPQDHLTDDEVQIWHNTLAALEPGWITAESYDQLAAYCQRVSNIHKFTIFKNNLDEALLTVDPLDPLPLKQSATLHKLMREETAMMLALARSLRITNQARRSSNITKNATVLPDAPDWENGQ